MKKINILLLSVVTMGSTFVSCSNADDNAPANSTITEKPANITLSGKYNFSQYRENYSTPADFTAGWADQDTQCADIPDYIEFKTATGLTYGDADTNNTTDCTLTKIPMTYSTDDTSFKVKNLAGAGKDVTFIVVKNTPTDLQFKAVSQGTSYTYILTKAAN